jgi:hypothetical protein
MSRITNLGRLAAAGYVVTSIFGFFAMATFPTNCSSIETQLRPPTTYRRPKLYSASASQTS